MRFSVYLIATAIVAAGIYLPAQDTFLDRAGLSNQNFENIGGFLTARNSKIRAAASTFTATARNKKALPEGITILDDETINVEGRLRPDLIPVHYILLGYLGFLERDSSSKRYQEALVQRGFPASELPYLVELSKSARAKNFFSPKLAEVRRNHEEKMHAKLTRSQARAIVEDFSREQETVFEAWALTVLQELTPPARRVLILSAFEKIGPHSSAGLATYPASSSKIEKFLLNSREMDEVQK